MERNLNFHHSSPSGTVGCEDCFCIPHDMSHLALKSDKVIKKIQIWQIAQKYFWVFQCLLYVFLCVVDFISHSSQFILTTARRNVSNGAEALASKKRCFQTCFQTGFELCCTQQSRKSSIKYHKHLHSHSAATLLTSLCLSLTNVCPLLRGCSPQANPVWWDFLVLLA